ncbi:hypothetical protein ACERIT_14430 [Halopenitus sp. H-Gu1]
MIPLAHGLVRAPDYPLEASIREAGVIQKCCFNTLFGRRIFTRKYFLLACLLNYAI